MHVYFSICARILMQILRISLKFIFYSLNILDLSYCMFRKSDALLIDYLICQYFQYFFNIIYKIILRNQKPQLVHFVRFYEGAIYECSDKWTVMRCNPIKNREPENHLE